MTPRQSNVNFLVDQQVRKYRADLQSWITQVRSARSVLDTLRVATHKPAPSHLIRALPGLWSGERMRADFSVEEILRQRLNDVASQDPSLPSYQRMVQGHWPQIYRLLAKKMQDR